MNKKQLKIVTGVAIAVLIVSRGCNLNCVKACS